MTAQLLDLSARVARDEAAVARVAAAPVRHVPAAFLAALLLLEQHDPDLPATGRGLRPAR